MSRAVMPRAHPNIEDIDRINRVALELRERRTLRGTVRVSVDGEVVHERKVEHVLDEGQMSSPVISPVMWYALALDRQRAEMWAPFAAEFERTEAVETVTRRIAAINEVVASLSEVPSLVGTLRTLRELRDEMIVTRDEMVREHLEERASEQKARAKARAELRDLSKSLKFSDG